LRARAREVERERERGGVCVSGSSSPDEGRLGSFSLLTEL